MLDQVVFVAAVTLLGLLEQVLRIHFSQCISVSALVLEKKLSPACPSLSAYFSLQVIYARRKFSISPPATTGHPEFERIFRAHFPSNDELTASFKCCLLSWASYISLDDIGTSMDMHSLQQE
ncbi:hypothetical protein P4O66_020288, partial [Electrophorus voltai]